MYCLILIGSIAAAAFICSIIYISSFFTPNPYKCLLPQHCALITLQMHCNYGQGIKGQKCAQCNIPFLLPWVGFSVHSLFGPYANWLYILRAYFACRIYCFVAPQQKLIQVEQIEGLFVSIMIIFFAAFMSSLHHKTRNIATGIAKADFSSVTGVGFMR